MRTTTRTAMFLLATGLGACAADGDLGNGEDEAPVAPYEAILGGTPDNSTLPDDNKADAVYPRQYDLLATQSPVKSQGSRGVCSIFSTVALMESLYIKAGQTNPDFSEQYLQWSVKNEVGAWRNTSGSNAGENLRAIHEYGIPAEAAWPYESFAWSATNDPGCTGPEANQPVVCFTNGDPSEEAMDAHKFTLPQGKWLNVNSIKPHITAKKTGVIIGVDFFYQAWNHRASTLPVNADAWRQGYVLSPNTKDVDESHKKRAGHSILIVGWNDDLEVAKVDAEGKPTGAKEKGFYLFKNSWGTSGFGLDNPFGPGYGWIAYSYVNRHGSAYVSDVPTVTAPPTPAGEHFAATPNLSIPDDNQTGVSSTISVSSSTSVGSLAVAVDITHTYIGDLTVELTHGGRTATLHAQVGGSDDNIRKTFTVSDFNGTSRSGAWTLTVRDTYGQDVGTLNSWSMDIAAPR
jgi:C1A family cysteine protease